MQLRLATTSPETVEAGYVCTCGCRPNLTYERGAAAVEDTCCCGNHFVVGPHAESRIQDKEGFHPEVQEFDSPWGEPLEAAWSIGPGTHPS